MSKASINEPQFFYNLLTKQEHIYSAVPHRKIPFSDNQIQKWDIVLNTEIFNISQSKDDYILAPLLEFNRWAWSENSVNSNEIILGTRIDNASFQAKIVKHLLSNKLPVIDKSNILDDLIKLFSIGQPTIGGIKNDQISVFKKKVREIESNYKINFENIKEEYDVLKDQFTYVQTIFINKNLLERPNITFTLTQNRHECSQPKLFRFKYIYSKIEIPKNKERSQLHLEIPKGLDCAHSTVSTIEPKKGPSFDKDGNIIKKNIGQVEFDKKNEKKIKPSKTEISVYHNLETETCLRSLFKPSKSLIFPFLCISVFESILASTILYLLYYNLEIPTLLSTILTLQSFLSILFPKIDEKQSVELILNKKRLVSFYSFLALLLLGIFILTNKYLDYKIILIVLIIFVYLDFFFSLYLYFNGIRKLNKMNEFDKKNN